MNLWAQMGHAAATNVAPVLTQNPVADGYVRDGAYGAKSFGTATALLVKNVTYSGYTRQVYLKFDLTALTPAYDHVILRLFGSRDPATPVVTPTTEAVRGVVNDSWNESNLTWKTRPVLGDVLDSVAISEKTARWYEWDVSSFVLARKAAGSRYATLALAMPQPPAGVEGADVFSSRESLQNKPQLVFSATPPPSAPDPVPAPSAPPSPVVDFLLPATADSYVRDGTWSDHNFGSDSTLLVKNVTYDSYTRQTLVKFDISSLPSTLQQVMLRVYGSRVTGAGTTSPTLESVYGVPNGSWSERTVTWNTRPSLGDKLDTVAVTDQTPRWYEWDVTSFIAAQKSAGRATASLAIAMDEPPAGSEGYDIFQSRESGTGPQLAVTVAPGNSPTPAPTATPVSTPEPTPIPTPEPTPVATPITTPMPTAVPTPVPSITPEPTAAPPATPKPTAPPVSTPLPTAPPVTTPAAKGTDFYIDAKSGNDANSGLTASSAWKSLAPVNATTFDAGDRLLFRAGTRYTGHLQLQGSGTAAAPIIVSSYGTGALPAIDGNGLMETVLLQNEEYWEITNLEITNNGSTRVAGRNGLLVQVTDFGTAHHIVLNNLYVHDVNGSNNKSLGGGHGINITAGGAITPSNFDEVLVKNCVLERCDRNGLTIGNDNYWRTNWKPNTRVLVQGNRLLDIGGDGIVVASCVSPLVQYNVLQGGRQRAWDAAAGIWPWSCDNAVFQYNEVSGMAGTVDGQAFDCDYNCNNTLYQYNYSHDNEGGFMLLCDDGTKNVRTKNVGNVGSIIRYNVSQNDGTRTFQVAGPVRDALIYNNVFYTAPGTAQMAVVSYNGWGPGTPTNIQFANNVFYGTSNNKFVWNTWTPATFTNNCFYGVFNNLPVDSGKITSDPQFVGPGTGGTGLNSVAGYKLKDSSPLIGAGVIIDNNGGQDFWGFGVDAITRPSIGADNN